MIYKVQWYSVTTRVWVDYTDKYFWTQRGAAKFAVKKCLGKWACQFWRVVRIKNREPIMTFGKHI